MVSASVLFVECPEMGRVSIDGTHEEEVEEDPDGSSRNHVHEADSEGEDRRLNPQVAKQTSPVQALDDAYESIQDIKELVLEAGDHGGEQQEEDDEGSRGTHEVVHKGHVVDLFCRTSQSLLVHNIIGGAVEDTLAFVEIKFFGVWSFIAGSTFIGAMACAEQADGVAPGTHISHVVIERSETAFINASLVKIAQDIFGEESSLTRSTLGRLLSTSLAKFCAQLALHGRRIYKEAGTIRFVAEGLIIRDADSLIWV